MHKIKVDNMLPSVPQYIIKHEVVTEKVDVLPWAWRKRTNIFVGFKYSCLLGSNPNLLHQEVALLCQKRAVTDTRNLSAFILSWNGEQDTEYGYEYKIQETMARLIVVNRIGELQLPTHLIFAVYK